MFERRLKILLFLLCLASGALALRAAQLQWWQHGYWVAQASKMMRQSELIETTRGRILDRNGAVLAEDQPCIDACVDYRAITDEPDPAWIENLARQELHHRLADQYLAISRSADFPQMLQDQEATLRDEITQMWACLAKVDDQTPDQIDDIRRDIVAEVTMRKRYMWWRNYENAQKGSSDQQPAWYRHFLGDSGLDEDQIDKFTVDVREQVQPHVILHAITPPQQALLARQLDRFFALSLVPGKHREYPAHRVACHIIGTIGPVGPQQSGANDPFGPDELRRYKQTDQIGRDGVEALCEPALRGTRGRVERAGGTGQVISRLDPVPGRDIRLSIDAALQADLENALDQQRTSTISSENRTETRQHEHGAAVVIKVDTGEVLALASNPGYDLNDLDVEYPLMAQDYINLPLLNRATQMAVEPGSTVKPIVGSAAITAGVISTTERIPCNGTLIIDGKAQPFGHCWIFEETKHGIPIPSHNIAAGDDALPPEGLTITDGIERSCNVVFETVADRLRMQRLMYWYDRFGLGRPTGIGIAESPGRIFRPGKDAKNAAAERALCWAAGIGEEVVHATPLQMANAAATLARDGIWLRPRLVQPQDSARSTTQPDAGSDRVDLHLAPDAIAAVQKGMYEDCNERDGMGRAILPEMQPVPTPNDPLASIHIAGKTGTAQSSQLTIPQRDAQGNIEYVKVPVGTPGTETWYQDKEHFDHAWFIGYAPYEHPQVAFCVFVEYGEGGGRVAGPIAHDLLEACIRHGYLDAR
jgi:penicillin-binding protein 2